MGYENCNGVVCAWGYMRTLNVLFGEKIEEIEEKLRAEKNALRYVIDNNVIFMEPYGLQSSTMGMICAANLFGKVGWRAAVGGQAELQRNAVLSIGS